MQFTQDDLIPLKQALITGVTSISTNGRTVAFRSLSEIRSIIAEIEASIDASSPSPSKINPNKIRATFTK